MCPLRLGLRSLRQACSQLHASAASENGEGSVSDFEVHPVGTKEVLQALTNGCNALLGLIQLISQRNDLPEGLGDLLHSHRVIEAKAALLQLEHLR